ncbi:hypothetical protein NDU88_006619 [Pleurodeles waltl]|uniref:Uncharacterized protein n=1 Tax=Pleurodeles waltl TaxID=8319 RepID=A0AAV7LCL5_PLEWA|nr:hypothetical protein NDU88_006619 [Pleurodeles waltl]
MPPARLVENKHHREATTRPRTGPRCDREVPRPDCRPRERLAACPVLGAGASQETVGRPRARPSVRRRLETIERPRGALTEEETREPGGCHRVKKRRVLDRARPSEERRNPAGTGRPCIEREKTEPDLGI